MTITLRAVKGTALTHNEMDGNFTDLSNRVITLESLGGGGVVVQDEGTPLSTTATTLNFVGAGVTSTGAGATKTITIPGSGSATITVKENDVNVSTSVTTLDFVGSDFDVVESPAGEAGIALASAIARVASPTFTGTPSAPTAAAATNTTQLATTAFVFAERSASFAMTGKTYNGLTLTTTTGTFTLANGKTISISNTLTLAGTDSTTMTFPPVTASLGYLGLPQNSRSAAYTAVIGDSANHIFHPSADTTARTWTIPANASVAYPVGTTLTFVNQNGAGEITIAITTDTMRLAGAGTTGSRTLAANGIATALKITTTEWIINGTGLT